MLELVEFFDNAILTNRLSSYDIPLELVEFFDNAILRAREYDCDYSLELVEFFDNAILYFSQSVINVNFTIQFASKKQELFRLFFNFLHTFSIKRYHFAKLLLRYHENTDAATGRNYLPNITIVFPRILPARRITGVY